MIKLAIIGGRDFTDYDLLLKTLDQYDLSEIEVIVSGGARGADSLAVKFAEENNIPTLVFPAEWEKYGRAAGMIRNKKIIDNCTSVLAFWDGVSRGTANSIGIAKKKGIKCRTVLYNTPNGSLFPD